MILRGSSLLCTLLPRKKSICEVLENLALRRTSHTSVRDVQRDRWSLSPKYPTRKTTCVYGYPEPGERERDAFIQESSQKPTLSPRLYRVSLSKVGCSSILELFCWDLRKKTTKHAVNSSLLPSPYQRVKTGQFLTGKDSCSCLFKTLQRHLQ